MDERRLEVFASVARRLSFSDAARALHLSQPAVSQHVAALEVELGSKLFDRTTRRVRLTPAGAALLARADTLMREHAEARRAVAAAEGRIAGDLRVAASLTIGAYMLPPALAVLARRHPEVRTRVTIQNTEQVIAALLSGRADVGFVEGERVEKPGIAFHPIRSDELVLIAQASHRFAGIDPIPISELKTEPFVLRELGSGTRQVAETHLREAGLETDALRVVAELSSIDAIKAAVSAGLGISIISQSAIPAGGVPDVIVRRISAVTMTREMAAATLAGSRSLPAVELLIALVE